MRTLWLATLVAAGTLSAAPMTAQAQKVGYIDSRRALSEAPGAQEASTQIQAEMAKFQTQVRVLEDSVNRMMADYQQKSVTMSADARTRRESEIAQARTRLQQQAQQIEQQAVQKQEELMQPVMQRVEQVIDEIRREGGYGIIFDVASGAMISADTTLDITTQVINRLKASQSSSSARR
jgi:outer membrane protein